MQGTRARLKAKRPHEQRKGRRPCPALPWGPYQDTGVPEPAPAAEPSMAPPAPPLPPWGLALLSGDRGRVRAWAPNKPSTPPGAHTVASAKGKWVSGLPEAGGH